MQPNNAPRRLMLASLIALAPAAVALETQEPHGPHDHDAASTHAHDLHFLHPLITESPLPENEARLELVYDRLADGGDLFTLTGTGEYAIKRWFSVEFSAPFSFLDPAAGSDETGLGDLGVGVKFASFAFEDHGLLLATGLELGLPTGDDERGIGNDHTVEIEPWLGFGYRHEDFEWVGRLGFGIPTNQNGNQEADVEIEWATSLLMHLPDDRFAAMLEFDGVSIYGEEEDGFNNISVTPGLRVYPFDSRDTSFGIGVRLPLTDDRESDVQGIFTLFMHY